MRERVRARKGHRYWEDEVSSGGLAPAAAGTHGPFVKTMTEEILSLQHTAGNAAVASLIGGWRRADEMTGRTTPARNGGVPTAQALAEDEDGPAPDVGLELEPAAPTLAPLDPHIAVRPEAGFVDAGRTAMTRCGGATLDPSDTRPHAFVDNGRTGTEAWAGGQGLGARGDQPAGSADKAGPVYEVETLNHVVRRSARVPSGRVTEAEASVRAGTGRITRPCLPS